MPVYIFCIRYISLGFFFRCVCFTSSRFIWQHRTCDIQKYVHKLSICLRLDFINYNYVASEKEKEKYANAGKKCDIKKK